MGNLPVGSDRPRLPAASESVRAVARVGQLIQGITGDWRTGCLMGIALPSDPPGLDRCREPLTALGVVHRALESVIRSRDSGTRRRLAALGGLIGCLDRRLCFAIAIGAGDFDRVVWAAALVMVEARESGAAWRPAHRGASDYLDRELQELAWSVLRLSRRKGERGPFWGYVMSAEMRRLAKPGSIAATSPPPIPIHFALGFPTAPRDGTPEHAEWQNMWQRAAEVVRSSVPSVETDPDCEADLGAFGIFDEVQHLVRDVSLAIDAHDAAAGTTVDAPPEGSADHADQPPTPRVTLRAKMRVLVFAGNEYTFMDAPERWSDLMLLARKATGERWVCSLKKKRKDDLIDAFRKRDLDIDEVIERSRSKGWRFRALPVLA